MVAISESVSDRVDFAGGSVASRLLSATLRRTVKPAINVWAIAPELPWPYGVVDQIGRMLPPIRGTKRRTVKLPHASAETTRPAAMRTDRYVIYMHGGAFMVGGRHLHRQLVSRIATRLRSEVIAVEYRMLPRYTITDGVQDCVDAYRFALAKGIAPENIAFMGDSAGAYLVFMTAVVAREQGLPLPGAIVSMAPVIDFDLHSKLDAPTAKSDVMFTRFFARSFRRFVIRHCPDPAARRQLIDVDLAGLPPSLIQVSSTELLYPDGERIAEELAKAGVPHQLQVWHDQMHVFQIAASVVPEAVRALDEIASFVEGAFAARRRKQSA